MQAYTAFSTTLMCMKKLNKPKSPIFIMCVLCFQMQSFRFSFDMSQGTTYPKACISAQRRLRSACFSTQSDQRIHKVLCGNPRTQSVFPVSIFFYKSIAGRYRPVRVAYGPITARYIFIKNANWVQANCEYSDQPAPTRRLI